MKKLLGVDYGEVRMGFAVSDPLGCMALPLQTVTVTNAREALAAVVRLCEEQEADEIVLGLPLSMDGSQGTMAKHVLAFVEKLRERVSVPIHTWDERLSSSQVERVLLESGMRREKRKAVRDKLAAQVILQGYIDSQMVNSGDDWEYDEPL